MNPVAVTCIVFALVFGSFLLGMVLRKLLPQHAVSGESREVVQWGMSLVLTLAALVLGLLVASAKSYFDTQTSELTQMCSNIVLLDHTLARYGPETASARQVLSHRVRQTLNEVFIHRTILAKTLRTR